MTNTRNARFRLVDELVKRLTTSEDWSVDRQSLLLATYGLPKISREHWSNVEWREEIGESLLVADDETLSDIAAHVLGQAPASIEPQRVIADGRSVWRSSGVRIFLSHVAEEKRFVGQVASILAKRGIQGFVAHEAIREGDENWMESLQTHLNSCDAFVAFLHSGYFEKVWTNQEVGWALALGKPSLFIRCGSDPKGFAMLRQGAKCGTPLELADLIFRWLNLQPGMSESIGNSLISELSTATGDKATLAAVSKIAVLRELTPEQWELLDEAYIANWYSHSSQEARQVLEAFYRSNERQIPPPF